MRAAELLNRQIEASQGEWVLPMKHFSATSLKMAMTCAEQYRQRYILGKRQRPGAALIQGSADHAAHEHNFEQKIKSGTDLGIDEIVERYHAAWDFEVEAAGDEVKWDGKPDDIRKHGARMVELYAKEVAPRIQPVAVEWEFTTPLETVPLPMYGKLDLLAGEPGDAPKYERIIERKTSKRTEKKPKTQWSLQGRIYQMVAAQELKVALPIEWHVVTKLKTPTVLTPLTPDTKLYKPFSGVEAEHTRLLIERAVWRLNAMYLQFGPDESWEGDGIVHDWACDWCAYANECIWVAR